MYTSAGLLILEQVYVIICIIMCLYDRPHVYLLDLVLTTALAMRDTWEMVTTVLGTYWR